MIDELLTEKELGEWLRVSRSTMQKLRAHDLPHVRVGSLVRYSKADVEAWLDRHQGLLDRDAEGAEENQQEECIIHEITES